MIKGTKHTKYFIIKGNMHLISLQMFFLPSLCGRFVAVSAIFFYLTEVELQCSEFPCAIKYIFKYIISESHIFALFRKTQHLESKNMHLQNSQYLAFQRTLKQF